MSAERPERRMKLCFAECVLLVVSGVKKLVDGTDIGTDSYFTCRPHTWQISCFSCNRRFKERILVRGQSLILASYGIPNYNMQW
jgi:hypothetical protein